MSNKNHHHTNHVSVVITVKNEAQSIRGTLKSLLSQTYKPGEILVVDGGSTDKTSQIISEFKGKGVKYYSKTGNRSVGRNEGIKRARNNIIAITDSGCIANKDWVKKISEPIRGGDCDVVAGYYRVNHKATVFQRCLATYTLVMNNNLLNDNFLPASRSMALTRKILNDCGGFPEEFSYNEDYVLARRLKSMRARRIRFAKEAVVEWEPRKEVLEAFWMFLKFAFGDAQAGTTRNTLPLLFIRAILFIILFLLALFVSNRLWVIIALLSCLYLVWAVNKNYKYVGVISATMWLPLLQLISDIAVLIGSFTGYLFRLQISSVHHKPDR